jgi:hypothetical protein
MGEDGLFAPSRALERDRGGKNSVGDPAGDQIVLQSLKIGLVIGSGFESVRH